MAAAVIKRHDHISNSVLLLSLVFARGVTLSRRLLGVVVNRLVKCPNHVLLEGFLLKNQAVLVPNEVGHLQVEGVPLHAGVKQVQNVPVVGIVHELERAAVLHEFLELSGLVLAKLANFNLLLLALDIVIFLVLGTAGETLPGQRSS